MRPFKIGVLADSFRLPPEEGVRKAAELGAEGVQVYAVGGEVTPEAMDAAKREEFKALCAGLGLEISAICGDVGGHGFQREDESKEMIPRSKAIVDLARDLGTPVVTTHVGVIPDDPADATYRTMRATARELGRYAESKGVAFAIETGPEKAAVLRRFLDDVGSRGVGVNMDPANLVMVVDDDPVEAVRTLAGHIVHTHAKDGVQHQPCDAAEVYGAFADGGFAELEKRMGKLFEELPLGKGAVDWDAYLDALEETGYRGFLTVEREVGADPASDIAEAIRFLKEKIR